MIILCWLPNAYVHISSFATSQGNPAFSIGFPRPWSSQAVLLYTGNAQNTLVPNIGISCYFQNSSIYNKLAPSKAHLSTSFCTTLRFLKHAFQPVSLYNIPIVHKLLFSTSFIDHYNGHAQIIFITNTVLYLNHLIFFSFLILPNWITDPTIITQPTLQTIRSVSNWP